MTFLMSAYILYLPKILQSQHPDPPRVRMPPFGPNWGIFKRRFWGFLESGYLLDATDHKP